MTISTSSFYDRSRDAMTSLTAQADLLNTQISTTKKIQAPSDDPLAYSRLRSIATQNADGTAYAGNLKMASASLASADTALSSITAQITQAQTLATQAASGTLNADDRKAIGEQLAGVLQTLVSLANTKDQSGHALFGDTTGAAAVTQNADGTYTFASGSSPTIPIGDGQSVQGSVTASQIFAQSGGTNTLKTIADLAASLQAGNAPASDGIDALSAAGSQVDTAQASVGARAARVDLEQASNTDAATTRETLRSGLEDTDITSTITELQKTMTTLQATQASFTKLSSLSLFDYLK